MILRLCRSEYILRVKFVKRRTIKLNQEQIQFSCDVIPVLLEFHVRPAEVTLSTITGNPCLGRLRNSFIESNFMTTILEIELLKRECYTIG